MRAALSACGTLRSVPAPAPSAAPAAAPHAPAIDVVEAERPHASTITWIKRLCDDDVPGSQSALRAVRTGRDVPRLQTILVEEGLPPEMVEIKFTADKTFVPALEASMKSSDPRELGARFFHVFVQ